MLKERNFDIKVKTREPLRIGGKKDPLSGADNPVTRVGGRLVIPGSSLKGALRDGIERFLIDTYFVEGKWKDGYEPCKPCIPTDELSADEKKLVRAGKYRDQNGNCRYPCTDRKCKSEKHSICPVCYLLGAMGLSGFVRVPFLYADVSVNELYSSRIDRATMTIAKGTNRPYELVPDDTDFKGTMTVLLEDSVVNWKIGEPRDLGEVRTRGDEWLVANKGKVDDKFQEEFIKTYITDRLTAIKIIGGYKSKGFGSIEVSVDPTI